jgi:hypothetical protein
MEGIEYGYIHIKDGKVVGVRQHDSPTLRQSCMKLRWKRFYHT